MHQCRSDIALQIDETLTGNRLGNLQAPRGLADRASFGDSNESHEGIQLQHCSVFPDACFLNCSLDRTLPLRYGPGFDRGNDMLRYSVALFVTFLSAVPAFALEPFPSGFHSQDIKTNGTTLHVRIGGQGPAVVMLHGFGDTGDMWAPAAAALVKNHTVVVPDLRGMGLSSHPDTGYTKKDQAVDIV